MRFRHARTWSAPTAVATALLLAPVAEGAAVTYPATLTFEVTNPSVPTTATPNPAVVSIIERVTTQYLKISVRAQSSSFSPPIPGVSASNVRWAVNSAVDGTAYPGALTTSFQQVFVGLNFKNAGSAHLVWTLDPLPPGTPSGTYTLVLNWGFEKINGSPP